MDGTLSTNRESTINPPTRYIIKIIGPTRERRK